MKLADALDLVCSDRRHSSALAAALAPTPEAKAGKPDRARRPAPTARPGHQWWDITFAPLTGDDKAFGIVGFITVVGEPTPAAARKIPPSVMGLRERHAGHFSFDLFAGNSPLTQQFLGQLRHAAESLAPVWLVGEPGSGKETAARVIHHNGPRRERAFVGLDCAGLQPYLVESVLFGHGRLVDTDHIGTVYLKNPAALPRDLQSKLVDVFSRPQGVRLISGSCRSAAEEGAGEKLITEFHTALAVLELRVPPLRDRLVDLPRLIAHFLPGAAIDPEALDVLREQPWPGNLREFADTLAAAAATAGVGTILCDHLPRELRFRAGIDPPPPTLPPLNLDAILEAVEKRVIALALTRARGKSTKAAELLGMWQSRLFRRLKALDIPTPAVKPSEKDDTPA